MGWETLAAGALGGGLSYLGQSQANRANAKQAADMMTFQERMSSTAHQREVADLRAAGLNPILSANSGASTPSGAQATMQNAIGQGVSSAKDSATAAKDIDLSKEQKFVMQQQQNLQQAQIMKLREEQHALQLANQVTESSVNNAMMAARTESATRLKKALIDNKLVPVDAALDRAGAVTGAISNAVGAMKNLRSPAPPMGRQDYDESFVHPGTGEIYKERSVRYKR